MPKLSGYCKLYPIERLRSFPQWKEIPHCESTQSSLPGFVYLHDSYVVTRGILVDENVIFGDVTEEWIQYCETELEFSPSSQTLGTPESELPSPRP